MGLPILRVHWTDRRKSRRSQTQSGHEAPAAFVSLSFTRIAEGNALFGLTGRIGFAMTRKALCQNLALRRGGRKVGRLALRSLGADCGLAVGADERSEDPGERFRRAVAGAASVTGPWPSSRDAKRAARHKVKGT